MEKKIATIQSLDRGIQLLLAIGDAGRPVSLGELTEVLGIDRSSVYRLLATLKQRGLCVQSDDARSYTLGPAIFRLSNQLRRSNPLLQVARKQVAALAGQTGETVHLAVRDGDRVVFLDYAVSSQAVGVSTDSTRSEPLHCTALGKALLADFGAQELSRLLGKGALQKFTQRTIGTIGELAEECGRVQQVGFAVDDMEFREGVRCIAAPVRDLDGQVVAALGLSAPSSRLTKARMTSIGAQVKAVAGAISVKLGFSGAGGEIG